MYFDDILLIKHTQHDSITTDRIELNWVNVISVSNKFLTPTSPPDTTVVLTNQFWFETLKSISFYLI